jgi:pimeloyl-ACP methyl ester carboxylesterase
MAADQRPQHATGGDGARFDAAHVCRTTPRPPELLAGEHDFVTLRSMQRWQQLVHQRLVVIPGAAHHALLEMPEVYGACLERFLREHEEPAIKMG